MQLKKAVVAVALGLSFATFAQAANYDLGALTYADPTISKYSAVGPGDFIDTYTFRLAEDLLRTGDLSLTVMASSIDITGPSDTYWLTNLTVTVYGGAEVVFKKNADETADSRLSLKGSFNVAASEYTLEISGWAGQGAGGIYNFQLVAGPPLPAVPEPAEYAMLLAGMGLVGMVVRRRKMS